MQKTQLHVQLFSIERIIDPIIVMFMSKCVLKLTCFRSMLLHKSREKTHAFKSVRIRWQTVHFIPNNPALWTTWKSQMDHVKQMQAKLTQLHDIDKWNNATEILYMHYNWNVILVSSIFISCFCLFMIVLWSSTDI